MTQKQTHTARPNRSSLSRRFNISLTVVVSVVVTCFAITLTLINSYQITAQQDRNTDSVTRLAQSSLAPAVWQMDHQSVIEVVDAIFKQPNVSLVQVLSNGEIIARRLRHNEAGHEFAYFLNNDDYITRDIFIKHGKRDIGRFQLAISMEEPHNNILLNALTLSAMTLALMIGIPLFTNYLAISHIFQPLRRISRAAAAIAEGDIDHAIPHTSDREVSRLSWALEDMRNALKRLITDLQQANEQLLVHSSALEQKVLERTRELDTKNRTLNAALEDVEQARRDAENANLTKTRFLAGMSHEIRTPMNAIMGMAEALLASPLNDDQQEYCRITMESSRKLMAIIDDVLDLSKIETGRLHLSSVVFDPAEIVSMACSIIKPAAKAKGLRFDVSLGKLPEAVSGDPARLRQILTNLLGNAVKFTDSGFIGIWAGQDAEKSDPYALRFTVEDSGAGIPPDKLGAVFDSFTQADDSTTREHGGSGLGLAISRQIIGLMGGKLWAESKVGKGSAFHFTAIFRDPDMVNRSHPSLSTLQGDSCACSKILVVEDSSYNTFVIKTFLKDTDIIVREASNGSEGLNMLYKERYDLVLMDMQMPIMDGYEALTTFREFEQKNGGQHTPIIAMTANALPEDARRCLEAGADMHLPKPVTRDALVEVIAAYTVTPVNIATPAPEPQADHTDEGTIQVSLDPDFLEIGPIYFNSVREKWQTCVEALGNEDFQTLKRIGHTLKGEGAAMGFAPVSEYGKEIQFAAEEKNRGTIADALNKLEDYLNRVVIL